MSIHSELAEDLAAGRPPRENLSPQDRARADLIIESLRARGGRELDIKAAIYRWSYTGRKVPRPDKIMRDGPRHTRPQVDGKLLDVRRLDGKPHSPARKFTMVVDLTPALLKPNGDLDHEKLLFALSASKPTHVKLRIQATIVDQFDLDWHPETEPVISRVKFMPNAETKLKGELHEFIATLPPPYLAPGVGAYAGTERVSPSSPGVAKGTP